MFSGLEVATKVLMIIMIIMIIMITMIIMIIMMTMTTTMMNFVCEDASRFEIMLETMTPKVIS